MPQINMSPIERLGQPEMVYRVPSTTRPNVYHIVIHWGSVKGITCSCEAATFGRHCKHVDMVPLCKVRREQVRYYSNGPVTAVPMECGLPEHHGGKHSWDR
jgi:hypothetical protein